MASACFISNVKAGCLGAGVGAGSCPAAPFRAPIDDIDHTEGCPAWAECCTEYGFCHPRVSEIMSHTLFYGNFFPVEVHKATLCWLFLYPRLYNVPVLNCGVTEICLCLEHEVQQFAK